ncbi:unnamed protein product [Angiostrongylus costaricensis]|uniref:Dirigent protein n=1 Tax=Angiostrongylus costaricensis TaxID=334426 RepID=A0A0R3PUE7_ANGCS|nr:unnamed protein product [Angiostrongylus costaricensis]
MPLCELKFVAEITEFNSHHFLNVISLEENHAQAAVVLEDRVGHQGVAIIFGALDSRVTAGDDSIAFANHLHTSTII